jgi:hypothetical protein
MKDSAVLFYFQDFLVGTEFMTDDEIGKYIRILCHLADKGSLSGCQLKRICKGEIPEAIIEKLKKDEAGNYYQKRMKEEREKRVNYSESRRINRTKKEEDMNNISKTYDKHMENENENENRIVIENNKELQTKFEIFRQNYPGTKRGHEIEFENLKKKHKNWKEIIPLLSDALTYQLSAREIKARAGGFVPEWKNLQTWINQRCWEEEIETNNLSNGTNKKSIGASNEAIARIIAEKFGSDSGKG